LDVFVEHGSVSDVGFWWNSMQETIERYRRHNRSAQTV